MPILYLIPTTLGECDLSSVLPSKNNAIVRAIRHFIVEDVRSARRFLRKVDSEFPIDDASFFVLNQHTTAEEVCSFLAPLKEGHDTGIISEAGCPAVADPGADIVKMAQAKGYKVVPLVGPSSILLALMASGLNGQNFAFAGYLPIKQTEREQAIRQLERRAKAEQQTQIFIETPYRNAKMLDDLLRICNHSTFLCIASNVTLETEFIRTKTIAEWKKDVPDLEKSPAIFLIN